jgi:hypothetical protein
MTPLIREMVGYTPEAETFMWFDLGKLPTEEVRFLVDGEVLTHIPFHKVIICCIDSDGDRCMLTLIGGNGLVAAAGFVLSPTSYEMVNAFAYMDTPEGLRLLPATEGNAPPQREQCYSVLCTIKHFLDLLGQKAVEAHQPRPKRSLINDKRKAKGKLPSMFDWHTVIIEPPATKADSQGGHHASPRQHDRRGHWRKHPAGRQVWVKPCKVGDASKGVIFKDYKVKDSK